VYLRLLPVLLWLSLYAGSAHAQASADLLYDEGLAEMQAGDFESGCPKLAESYRLEPLAGALFTLAECEAQWGKPVVALEHYEQYVEGLSRMGSEEREANEERRVVAVRQIESLRVQLAEASREAEPEPEPEPVGGDDAAGSGDSSQKTWAYVIGAVGIAAVLVSAITGAVALSEAGVVDDHCVGNSCDAEGKDAADAGQAMADVSTVSLILGGVAISTGVVLLVTAPDDAPGSDGAMIRWGMRW
jgi:hypothetical protein